MSTDVRVALVVVGLLAIGAALVWRAVVVSSRRRDLRTGLDAPDPQDRARAGIVLADEGLHRCARPLLGHVARETDARVTHAIALAVARRQWEPVDTRPVRQLREWAAQELARHGDAVRAFGPAVTRLSDMGGPRPPEPGGSAASAVPGPDEPPHATGRAATDRPPSASPAMAPTAAEAPAVPGVSWRAERAEEAGTR